jgi:hypothetical protein
MISSEQSIMPLLLIDVINEFPSIMGVSPVFPIRTNGDD